MYAITLFVTGHFVRRWVCTTTVACFLAAVPAMQGRFVDDANRQVELPPRVTKVLAAGAPAEVMLYTLAPDLLVARNRVPSGNAIEFFPPAYRTPVLIRQLPEVDDAKADAELLALQPDLYVDYGTVAADYIASLEAVQRRTGVPAMILDGALERIPAMYRRVGAAMGVRESGERLGTAAERLLTKYRGALSSSSSPVRVYLACSADGYMPCLADDSSGEQLAWLGGVNVAGTRAASPRRPRTIDEVRAMAPQVVVTIGPAARLRGDAAWQGLDAVKNGRVYEWPSLPYSWGARPPSVNRLPGVAWLAYVARGQAFDAAFDADIRSFYRDFYHLELTDAQYRALIAGG
jgi:iron complex transport system substrate-binding protein